MRLRDLADLALELTVVGSFTRYGFLLRRRLFGWGSPGPNSLSGRTVLVTGPTSGLGRAAAFALADLGARVVLVGRSEERLAEVRHALVAAGPDRTPERFPVVLADMASLASVRAAVGQVLATEPRLDVVVDNAGAIFADRALTEDGLERTFATLVGGPFALVEGLRARLEAMGGARVIAVTSGGMYTQAVDPDDVQGLRVAHAGARAYARAKRVQVTLVREWARRHGGRVTFLAMHPGWADTPGVAHALPAFHRVMGRGLRTPAQGADTIVWLATAPLEALEPGRLYLDRRPRPFDRWPGTRLTAAARARVWDAVVDLVGTGAPTNRRQPSARRSARTSAR